MLTKRVSSMDDLTQSQKQTSIHLKNLDVVKVIFKKPYNSNKIALEIKLKYTILHEFMKSFSLEYVDTYGG